ncbi:hypothetical protein ACH5RR_024531 [Cinchona calisaya]|uniref:Btz domain-containing protein n=1 Tax=Cinchona calisaya TaxID=153742 RepID=A0ABD2YWZ0_9GENT
MADEAKEEEVEYESDPEETKLSLKIRRREASDEEEDEGGNGEDRGRRENLKPHRRIVDSDVESDGQGAAAEYEDEEVYVDEEIIDEDEYVEEEEEYYEETRGEIGEVEVVEAEIGNEIREDRMVTKSFEGLQGSNDDGHFVEGANENQQGEEGEEEKKENEPCAVPTAGTFYMHDDRFRDNAGGRNRQTFGGRKLWESKDEKKWGHDKFEELTIQERHFDEGRRNSRGRYRGRGRNRGAEWGGYGQGNKPRTYNTSNKQNKNNNQNNVPKSVRGRGPRRYHPSFKNDEKVPPALNQHSGRVSALTSNVEFPAKKHVFASSLNSASPPFYPSASTSTSTSTSKEVALTQKRDVQPESNNRRIHHSVANGSFSAAQSSAVQLGKSVIDSIGVDTLYIDDSIATVAGKPSTTLQFPPGSLSMSSSQSLKPRDQGRGMNSLPQVTYQSAGPNSQVNRISPPTLLHNAQGNPVQNRGQPSLQASGQQFAQNPGGGSLVSSPPKAAINKTPFESGETESPSESNKSKAALVPKGKGSVQGGGRGSFLYGGAQVMGASGNLGTVHGDQNFHTFLPVMQFGGQHPGGVGVPAVGMAFPGYVAQPQLGLGNSEMTWLPVLAGAAGSLGATYCSPYLATDGSYQPRPSGQASSLAAASIKESNADKPHNEYNPSQRPEVANDDFVQRQKNPRRPPSWPFVSPVDLVHFGLPLHSEVLQVMFDKHLLMLLHSKKQTTKLDGCPFIVLACGVQKLDMSCCQEKIVDYPTNHCHSALKDLRRSVPSSLFAYQLAAGISTVNLNFLSIGNF